MSTAEFPPFVRLRHPDSLTTWLLVRPSFWRRHGFVKGDVATPGEVTSYYTDIFRRGVK